MTDLSRAFGFGSKKSLVPAMRMRYKGERTLTASDKEREKKKRKYKCDKCGAKFWSYCKRNNISKSKLLIVHHKREVYKSKPKGLNLPIPEFYYARRKRAYHDRPANLSIVCRICHGIVDEEKNKSKKRVKPFWDFGI